MSSRADLVVVKQGRHALWMRTRSLGLIATVLVLGCAPEEVPLNCHCAVPTRNADIEGDEPACMTTVTVRHAFTRVTSP